MTLGVFDLIFPIQLFVILQEQHLQIVFEVLVVSPYLNPFQFHVLELLEEEVVDIHFIVFYAQLEKHLYRCFNYQFDHFLFHMLIMLCLVQKAPIYYQENLFLSLLQYWIVDFRFSNQTWAEYVLLSLDYRDYTLQFLIVGHYLILFILNPLL